MMVGARAGRPSLIRRWLAAGLAGGLEAFVVPGAELLDELGLDAPSAGLRLVANPRHAAVLLVVGEIPPGLAHAAATVYAQQPRPRAVLAVGTPGAPPLPDADVTVEPTQADLERGVAELRRRMAAESWTLNPPAFRGADNGAGTSADSNREMDGMHHQEMSGMEHHEMNGGFMSMAAMTRDLPRSADGLPMEWLDVPFGPLFPGLPGGLDLVLTLDGDTVAHAVLSHHTLERNIGASWPGGADGFPDRLARIDPLARTAYRVLAYRALEAAVGTEPAADELIRRVAAVERERAASHLIWLGRFGFLLGDAWLARKASSLARAVRLAEDTARFKALSSDVAAFARQVQRTSLLARRLERVGPIDPADNLVGPVARASGLATDTRTTDHVYMQLGFEPVVERAGDASARLSVRLAEVEQSLELVLRSGGPGQLTVASAQGTSSSGRAAIETPRGGASLTLTLIDGEVVEVSADTPSTRLAAFVETVTRDKELADALIGVASLDLCAWELAR